MVTPSGRPRNFTTYLDVLPLSPYAVHIIALVQSVGEVVKVTLQKNRVSATRVTIATVPLQKTHIRNSDIVTFVQVTTTAAWDDTVPVTHSTEKVLTTVLTVI